jgi:2'-5' RNA ligase
MPASRERTPAGATSSRAGEALPQTTRHRIFIAVTLAPALREAVTACRTTLGEAADRFRWVPAQNLHFTLRFLGPITDAQVARAVDATREAAASGVSFAITLAGMGAFPSRRSPRVVWVGVTEGAERLVALASSLEAALRQRKFPPADHPFQAHLTVARARSEGRPPDLSAALPSQDSHCVGTQRVDALAVMESTLRPSGSIYHEVDREVLGESKGSSALGDGVS